MRTINSNRSIVINGHKSSVSLEEAFWTGLKQIASERHVTLSALVGSIDAERLSGNLSSAIRLFVLEYYRAKKGSVVETPIASGADPKERAPRT
jgi:predicted DNA-binding ribbon-helix-helix protein